MKHLGDITKINGAEIEPVDCICGGSPCQDLSVAGLRAGLSGERSGLFMEQIRIVKEMREHDKASGRTGESVRPRYMVWENVPGAFSSNGGKDFQAVLTEIIRIVEPEAPDVPLPDGGWPMAGFLCAADRSWSVAYKVHDAQFWGVPQRRKRICVLADFNGDSAGEILFDLELRRETADPASYKAVAGAGAEPRSEVSAQCQGVSGDPEPSGEEREGSAGQASGSTGDAGCFTLKIRGGCEGGGKGALVQTEKSGTLSCNNDQTLFCRNDQGGSCMDVSVDKTATLRAQEHGHQPVVMAAGFDGNMGAKAGKVMGVASFEPGIAGRCGGHCYDDVSGTLRANDVIRECGDTVPTLQSRMGTGGNQVPLVASLQALGAYKVNDVVSSVKARDYKDATDLVVSAVDCRNGTENTEVNGTLQAKSNGGQSLNYNYVVRVDDASGYPDKLTHQDVINGLYPVQPSIVRRLTPLECTRLQGFPDHWVDIGDWTDSKGKTHKDSDSAKYKALGNSIALPFWDHLLARISFEYDRIATLGSLFDGIGGFPYCWECIHGKGAALWASEIEEFPIAVTRKHFNEGSGSEQ